MKIGEKHLTESILYSPQSPVNLLGRDLMAKLNMTIHFQQDGTMICSVPGTPLARLMAVTVDSSMGDQLRARPVDEQAIATAVYVITNTPALTGRTVEFTKEFLFRRESRTPGCHTKQ